MASPVDIERSYDEFDRQTALGRIRAGVLLTFFVLPLGTFVDRFLYPAQWPRLLGIRIAFGTLMVLVGLLVYTPWGRLWHRALGVGLALVPAGCMAWIIHEQGGSQSPYYAGLNLVCSRSACCSAGTPSRASSPPPRCS